MPKYMLQIPEPCSEDWNQMTPLEKGRFCAVCEKEIYDFSTYTKQELVQHIQREGKVCGRIPTAFLDVDLISRSEKTGLRLNGIIAAAVNLLVLATATTVQGQATKTVDQNTLQKINDSEDEEKISIPLQPLKRIVTGQVVDEEGVGLPGAIVIIRRTVHGVSADFDGRFSIEIPEELDHVELLFSFVGTEECIEVIEDFEKPLLIELKDIPYDDEMFTMGFVIVKKKKKWLFF